MKALIRDALFGRSLPFKLAAHLLDLERIDRIARKIYENDQSARTLENILADTYMGELGEQALALLLRTVPSLAVIENDEDATHERHWDISVNGCLLEVKLMQADTVSFTRPALTETVCQQWRKLGYMVTWKLVDDRIIPWYLIDAKALDPELNLMEPSKHRGNRGFYLGPNKLAQLGLLEHLQ